MRLRIVRVDEDLMSLTYTGFLQHEDGVTLATKYPYAFYMGRVNHREFIEQILWVRANCSGHVAHNYDIRVMRNSARRGDRWHTMVAFSDPTSATLFKTVWGHALSTIGYKELSG
jgi:hypothetical protein